VLSPSFALARHHPDGVRGQDLAGGAHDDFGSSSHFAYGARWTIEGHLLGVEIAPVRAALLRRRFAQHVSSARRRCR